MSRCPHCTAAEQRPNRDGFTPGCDSCAARAIACTAGFRDSIESSVRSPRYRMALAHFFDGRVEQGNKLAQGWLRKLRAQQVQQETAR